MGPGQQKFQEFILERVKETEQEQAKALLAESFQKQSDRTFNQEYLLSFIPRMMSMLKPEHVDEVSKIMQEFGSNFTGTRE